MQTENRIQTEALQKEQQRTASLATKLDACQEKLGDAVATSREMRQENRDIRSHFEHYQQQIADRSATSSIRSNRDWRARWIA
jgi:uncharacterized membrane protein